jgi:hypothetical protein
MNEQSINPQTLNLRDIHLPEPISWWPLAPGWWIVLAAVICIGIAAVIARKIYRSRQLKRDISAELEEIKQQFQQTQNKSSLAKSLSILLRRASISYFSSAYTAEHHIAGLTGEHWLVWLDETHASTENRFQSETGKVLLNAPYLPENSALQYDAQQLIQLCESWLLSSHKTKKIKTRRVKTQQAPTA